MPLSDRLSEGEAVMVGFVTERNLSPIIAEDLRKLCYYFTRDPEVLPPMKWGRTSAGYKMKYGLAETFCDDLSADAQKAPFFSLDLHEATSSNHQKVLAVLISFFSPAQQRVVVHHLGSVPLVKCDSVSVYTAVVKLVEDKWNWCFSVLMDSKNVMR